VSVSGGATRRSVAKSKDMSGLKVVVTAGPTQEPIDPVRYISNRSSGKMGYALAASAQRRGAEVTLISGPVALERPSRVELVPVVTALDMHEAVMSLAKTVDVLVMAAAVGDYRVAEPSERKIKRTSKGMSIKLLPNPDILAAVGLSRGKRRRPFIVGFALETEDLFESASAKLKRKGCDLLVANLAEQSIGRDASIAYILDAEGIVEQPGELSKEALADRIFDVVIAKMQEKG